MSYFVSPKDAESAKDITHALIDALGMILSFKFGVHVQSLQTPPGGSIQQKTEMTASAPPEQK